MLIIAYCCFLFPFAYGSHREGCTKADDALRSQFADDGFICLLVTRESVRLVNDYEWTCGTQCVKRPVVSFDSHIIVIACEHLAGSEQSTVHYQHIYLVSVQSWSFHEGTHCGRKIFPAFLLFFHSFQHTHVYLRIIAQRVFKMCFDIRFVQKSACAGFDGNAWNGNDELVYAITFVQFKDGVCIYVCLACACFHLDVQTQGVAHRLLVSVFSATFCRSLCCMRYIFPIKRFERRSITGFE